MADTHLHADMAAISARLDGIDDRLRQVEARQLELLQLASFGKGSLKRYCALVRERLRSLASA